MTSPQLKTAISGSFKFKPEIDALHEEFRDHGVTVLAPEKGWLWNSQIQISPPPFRPLPSEEGLDIKQIEGRFLRAIDKANFLYVLCPAGYIGISTGIEIGYAIGVDKPIYVSEPPDFMELAEGDLEHKTFLESTIVIAGVAQAVQIERSKLE